MTGPRLVHRDGVALSYATVARYLNNDLFMQLVRWARIGSRAATTKRLTDSEPITVRLTGSARKDGGDGGPQTCGRNSNWAEVVRGLASVSADPSGTGRPTRAGHLGFKTIVSFVIRIRDRCS